MPVLERRKIGLREVDFFERTHGLFSDHESFPKRSEKGP
jgi:hypothetical protein